MRKLKQKFFVLLLSKKCLSVFVPFFIEFLPFWLHFLPCFAHFSPILWHFGTIWLRFFRFDSVSSLFQCNFEYYCLVPLKVYVTLTEKRTIEHEFVMQLCTHVWYLVTKVNLSSTTNHKLSIFQCNPTHLRQYWAK